jgi:uncharacterized membrane protein
MSADLGTLLAILGMAAATYGVRAGGFFLVQRLPASPFLDAWLRHVPGAVFVALVALALARGGPDLWAAAAVAALVSALRGNLALSLAAGVATAAAVRHLAP